MFILFLLVGSMFVFISLRDVPFPSAGERTEGDAQVERVFHSDVAAAFPAVEFPADEDRLDRAGVLPVEFIAPFRAEFHAVVVRRRHSDELAATYAVEGPDRRCVRVLFPLFDIVLSRIPPACRRAVFLCAPHGLVQGPAHDAGALRRAGGRILFFVSAAARRRGITAHSRQALLLRAHLHGIDRFRLGVF